MHNKLEGIKNNVTTVAVLFWTYTDIHTYLLNYLLTPWSRVPLEKLTGSQLVKKFPHFMEPEDSFPHSQVHASCPYPELA